MKNTILTLALVVVLSSVTQLAAAQDTSHVKKHPHRTMKAVVDTTKNVNRKLAKP